MRPTVLHFLGYDRDHGGILSVVRNLARTGQFDVILGVGDDFVQSRDPKLELLRFPPVAAEDLTAATFLRSFGLALRARRWLRADGRRIFHGHSRVGLLTALWLNVLGEGRVVASVHCYGRQRWLYRWAAALLGRKLFWLSPAMKHYYLGRADWDGCIPECGVPPVAHTVARQQPPPWWFGGIGMLVAWKGWHVVLQAFLELSPEVRRRVRFVHVGGEGSDEASRKYAAELREQVDLHGLQDCVSWLGPQPSAAPVLDKAHALIVASDHEPLSVAMLEALHLGLPVIAADSGGARDVIQSGQNGWLFRTGDARDLARQLTTLVESNALNKIWVDPASVARFSPQRVADQWAEVYRGLIKGSVPDGQ